MTFRELPYSVTFRPKADARDLYLKIGTHQATNMRTHKVKRFEADDEVEKSH